MSRICCECKEPLEHGGDMVMCADCRGWFHYPDARLGNDGPRCGVHIHGLREFFGRDVVPLCLRCDMAFRLAHEVPS